MKRIPDIVLSFAAEKWAMPQFDSCLTPNWSEVKQFLSKWRHQLTFLAALRTVHGLRDCQMAVFPLFSLSKGEITWDFW